MNFFAHIGKRPIRLSEETRKFALDSLDGIYGREAMKNYAVSLDDIETYSSLDDLQKQDVAIREICKNAPIRIIDGEKLSGSASLGLAIKHKIPATFNGTAEFDSVSHLTVDFETVLKEGAEKLEADANYYYEKYKGTDNEAFLKSSIDALEGFRIYRNRFLEALKDKPQFSQNYEALLSVPFKPAKSFYEALQSLWFTFSFIRLLGNWTGIGRIDYLLGDYLKNDLANGVLTLDEARELLAHFFIKGCEWICGGNYGSGDAQHYQNIVLGGIDENGKDITNEVTYLVLDILEETGISDFPTTVRINDSSPEKLLKRVAEVIRFGGGVVAIYNEKLIIDSLVSYGYSIHDAGKFANDGCWEVQIPGETFFRYIPFDGLSILQNKTLNSYKTVPEFKDFDSLYSQYIKDLSVFVEGIKLNAAKYEHCKSYPSTIVSLFEKNCFKNGRSYTEAGTTYNVISPHIGGLPDVANSLYAIKKLCFEDKKATLQELLQALERNWEGFEDLRLYALNSYKYFGNDNDEVDKIAAHIVSDFADICDRKIENCEILFPAGISTFGRQIEWSPNRLATASGQKAHAILSANFSPTPGTDSEGATAIINSYCKADLKRTISGAALDIKFLPQILKGNSGLDAIITLIKVFCDLGGHFMQLDIADVELLKKAQENPEEYRSLSVRVSGWNARFVTLNREWQDMIIKQASGET